MSITASVLEDLAEGRHFAKRTLEIAKRLFIEGETPTHLALGYGLSVQRIYCIRDRVLAAAKAKALPEGWEEVTIAAPRPVIREIRERLAEASESYRVSPRVRSMRAMRNCHDLDSTGHTMSDQIESHAVQRTRSTQGELSDTRTAIRVSRKRSLDAI